MSHFDALLDAGELRFWGDMPAEPEPGEMLVLVVCPECHNREFHLSETMFWQCDDCGTRAQWDKVPHRVLLEREGPNE